MNHILLGGLHWLLLFVTVGGGPAIGLAVYELAQSRGASEARVKTEGIVAGAIATPVIVAISYGLYQAVGIPGAWKWIVG